MQMAPARYCCSCMPQPLALVCIIECDRALFVHRHLSAPIEVECSKDRSFGASGGCIRLPQLHKLAEAS